MNRYTPRTLEGYIYIRQRTACHRRIPPSSLPLLSCALQSGVSDGTAIAYARLPTKCIPLHGEIHMYLPSVVLRSTEFHRIECSDWPQTTMLKDMKTQHKRSLLKNIAHLHQPLWNLIKGSFCSLVIKGFIRNLLIWGLCLAGPESGQLLKKKFHQECADFEGLPGRS